MFNAHASFAGPDLDSQASLFNLTTLCTLLRERVSRADYAKIQHFLTGAEQAFVDFEVDGKGEKLLEALLALHRDFSVFSSLRLEGQSLADMIESVRNSLDSTLSEAFARGTFQKNQRKIVEGLILNSQNQWQIEKHLFLMLANQASWMGNAIAAQILGPLRDKALLNETHQIQIDRDVDKALDACLEAKLFLPWFRNFFPAG